MSDATGYHPGQFTFSSWDYFKQFAALLRAPIYRDIPAMLGNGTPILLIPGFLAGDWTLRTLAGWLNRRGYRAYLSGIDLNVACPDTTSTILQWRIEHITQETGQPLTLIGHSLGGMLARFLGVRFPEQISQVIALGSPISKPVQVNPLVEHASQLLQPLRRMRGPVLPTCGSLECPCPFTQQVFSPLPADVAFTSIFSKQDKVVHWQSSFDGQGTNYEVPGRHLGLIVNPYVYRILATTLATHSEQTA